MFSIVCCLASTLLITSCEDASLQNQEVNDIPLTTRAKPDTKVDVCHYDQELDEFQHINISNKALQKHINNHGDYEVDLAEADADGDGIADCADCFPEDAELGEKNTWYEDADGDGFGDPESSVETCRTLDETNAFFAEKEDPEDQKVFVDNDGDCDDSDPDVFEGCE